MNELDYIDIHDYVSPSLLLLLLSLLLLLLVLLLMLLASITATILLLLLPNSYALGDGARNIFQYKGIF